ncbi:MAG: cysteine--tRNA ligase, partial [Candidatus Cryptobacteroides sp.]
LINTTKTPKPGQTSAEDLGALLRLFDDIVFGVLGLKDEDASESGKSLAVIDGLMDMVLEERKAAKAARDWATSDRIRDSLKAIGIAVKDTRDGAEWSFE